MHFVIDRKTIDLNSLFWLLAVLEDDWFSIHAMINILYIYYKDAAII